MSDFEYRNPEEISYAREACQNALRQFGGIDTENALRIIDDVIAELKWHQDYKNRGEEYQRNELAKAAMQGTLSNPSVEYDVNDLAKYVYEYADAMIAEGKKE